MNRHDADVLAIYGTGGFGRETMPVLRELLPGRGKAMSLLFVDDAASESVCGGVPVVSFETLVGLPAARKAACIAVSDGVVRAKLAEKLKGAGIEAMEVRAKQAVVMHDVRLGEGGILAPFVTLTSNIKIGVHFHANIYSYVAHDCVIGDFVTFAPAVKCNGNVHIEDYAYIGTGAVIRQGTPEAPLVIGRGAVVGMGAVVTKSVPPNAVVVGNPARIKEG